MNSIVGVIEWSIVIVPLIVSILSIILFLNHKINFMLLFIGLSNFILGIYLPLCMFSYFHHANFIDFQKKNDFDYLIKNLYNNFSDAWILFFMIIIQISITVINIIYCFKKNRVYLSSEKTK